MKQRNCYKVAGHNVSLTGEASQLASLRLSPYEPFVVEPTDDTLFDVEIVEELEDAIIEPVLVDAPLSSSGMPKVDIFRVECGLLYQITMPFLSEINASLIVDKARRLVRVKLGGDPMGQYMAISNVFILSFVSFGMEHNTLLLHASTVIHEGRAYLFLGKSGTGKSTHSRMWLEAFPTSELLNDDHPLVRVHDDGSVIAYGSPWSGKTPCYRNLSAPLGAIVRIERSLANTLVPLSPLKYYASITTSCSGVQWSAELMESKVHAVEQIVKNSKGYTMRCLPNTQAAEVCFAGIKENQ